jgi:hypothetical protein
MNASTTICDCCDGITTETPVALNNRPGLAAIQYRVGNWAQFKASMLAALSTTPELAGLHTRDDDDFSIALLDAWAIACDILTFYQERIANESYLGTATELLSIAELARLIGYKPSPGVAASAALAFIMDAPLPLPKLPPGTLIPVSQANSAPTQVALGSGLKVQSIPDPGQLPATFETSTTVIGRASWNAIRPRTSLPVDSGGENASANVRLTGLHSELQVGDPLLLIAGDSTQNVQRIAGLSLDNDTRTTTVQFESNFSETPAALPTTQGQVYSWQIGIDDTLVWDSIKGFLWQDQNDLVAIATARSWSLDQLEAAINAWRGQIAPFADPPLQVFTLKVRASLFGHNAPTWLSLPASLRFDQGVRQVDSSGKPTASFTFVPAAFPTDWDDFNYLYYDQTFADAALQTPPITSFDLDTLYPPLVSGDFLVLQSSDKAAPTVIAPILSAVAVSRSDYMLSAKVTRIILDVDWNSVAMFGFRTTSILGQTDPLPVAEIALNDVVDNSAPLMLDGAYLSLKVGQLVAISGTSADSSNATRNEVTAIKSLSLIDGFTTLTFDPELIGRYVRDTATLNCNVVPATHGETRSEILGGGDATQPFQRFKLSQPPLTYVSAATPSGSRSTMLVRVNGIAWTEVPWLYGHGPTEKVYTLSVDQAGTNWVQFGDGVSAGARLTSGVNNVVATYRQGIGLAGMVAAGKLSTLLSRPLGLKNVSNPLPSSGGGDPETLAQARANAPVTVRTLDRIVSLEDFEDFSRASAGIAKARVAWTWDGTRNVACVTVAGLGGALVQPGTDQYRNLLTAMQQAGDGTVPVSLCDYSSVTFTLAATIIADPAHDGPTVLAAVQAAVTQAFSFDARDFMQPVYRSEVIAVMQDVPGVMALTLDGLAYSGATLLGSQPDALVAAAPTLGSGGLVGAQLLTLRPGPLTNVVLAS